MKIYILPEIEKRQKLKIVPNPYPLKMAQVIISPKARQNIEIRLNEEVSAIAYLKLKNGIGKEKGDFIYSTEVDEIKEVVFSEDDNPNNAHIFLIYTGDKWFLYFDFRYNKAIVLQHIDRSDEFLNSAEFSKEKKYWGPFIQNLFDASELLQKSILLLHANEIAMTAKSHDLIRSQFYLFFKNKKETAEFVETVKKLNDLRPSARYLRGELTITEEEANHFLSDIKALREEVGKMMD